MTEDVLATIFVTMMVVFALLTIGVYRNRRGWVWLATIALVVGAVTVANVAMAADSPVELRRTDKYGHPTGEGGYRLEGRRLVPVDKYGHRTGGDGYLIQPDGSVVRADKYGNPRR